MGLRRHSCRLRVEGSGRCGLGKDSGGSRLSLLMQNLFAIGTMLSEYISEGS
jgi:hypothetical protein